MFITDSDKDYLDLREQIKEKVQERSTCQKEPDGLSVFSIGRRKELKAKVSELSELIEELRFEEKSVIQGFGKEDAAGMKQVKGEISYEPQHRPKEHTLDR